MFSDGRRLGAHLPLGAGMLKAVDRANTIGAQALQVFADNPTAWRRRTNPPRELGAFRARLAELDIAPLAVHASYLVNLASPDETFYSQSIALLADELRAAERFEARYLNVHIGSHRDTGPAAGTARVADAVASALAEIDARPGAPLLVLENSAGGGFGLGSTIEELADILDATTARGVDPDRIRFCLDAAHLWGAGYRVSEPDEVDAVVEAFDERLGLDHLAMVHFNDSKAALGSRLDRHEHVGAGLIGPAGMARLLCHPKLDGVTFYIETPGMDEGYDAVNIARGYDLAAGRPLADLPPEAMELHRTRARTRVEPDPD
jgi:deoxyribonuclease-4